MNDKEVGAYMWTQDYRISLITGSQVNLIRDAITLEETSETFGN